MKKKISKKENVFPQKKFSATKFFPKKIFFKKNFFTKKLFFFRNEIFSKKKFFSKKNFLFLKNKFYKKQKFSKNRIFSAKFRNKSELGYFYYFYIIFYSLLFIQKYTPGSIVYFVLLTFLILHQLNLNKSSSTST